jgi:large subunit ribosomal protein L25
MAEITLEAKAGRGVGSRPTGRLRAAGRVPGVIYGHGTAPLPVSVDARDLRHALTTDAGLNQLLELVVDGQRHLTLARELQRHPVRNTVTHVDFLIVRRDEVIATDVPITLVGEAKEVEVERGVINHALSALTVRAVPTAIPNAFEVDISEMTIGDTIRVGDIRLPDGVTTDVDPEEPIVVAAPSAVAAEVAEEEAQAEAEAEAAAEGVAAEAAEEAGEAGAGEAGAGEGAEAGGGGDTPAGSES